MVGDGKTDGRTDEQKSDIQKWVPQKLDGPFIKNNPSLLFIKKTHAKRNYFAKKCLYKKRLMPHI